MSDTCTVNVVYLLPMGSINWTPANVSGFPLLGTQTFTLTWTEGKAENQQLYGENNLPIAISGASSPYPSQSGGFLFEYYLGVVPLNDDDYYFYNNAGSPYAFPD